ncbi:hypothetical protein FN846DRAFT_1022283 [Sphaerosporella brunnea]|uniref:BZIP domain-containing protein n=1 Tax=Sphaerosporella brunnea TaxID=1250544 RepID=A0A5J5EBP8_9PEZI|nr:hypothetical protein FN846DRAFT_896600 [Sphaerosporella brunnea]KAA8903339.1 hypothetical protein FN846DRAFT_1022283 [Sphaerosporella brunnea]
MASNPNFELAAAVADLVISDETAVADPAPLLMSEDETAVADPEEGAAKLQAAQEAQRLRKNHLSTAAYARKKAEREKEVADLSKTVTDLTIKYEQDKEAWLDEREVLLAYINHLQNLLVQK